MEPVFVSVIIPVYNGGKTLDACLSAVVSQDYDHYEAIVVDNNSTDNSKEIISRFAENNNKVRYVFEHFRSRGAARNRGIEEAQGEIIMMTDHDCIVPPHWIKTLIRPIVEEKEQIVMGYEEDIISNRWSSQIHQSNEKYFYRLIKDDYIDCLDTKNFAIRTDLMRELRFEPAIKNMEDIELSFRIKDKIRIRFFPDVKVGHYHKCTFKSWLNIWFNRGYWNRKVYEIHKNKDFVYNDPAYFYLKKPYIDNICEYIRSLYFILLHFRKNNSEQKMLKYISSLIWRAGLFSGGIL